MQIDKKQERLIEGWIVQSQQSPDPYFRFMSLWIAFNALCYALFHGSANQNRADLKRFKRGSSGDAALNARVLLEGDKVEINADLLQMRLKIAEKYTEETIFSEFARATQADYCLALDNNLGFRESVDYFHEAVRKHNGHYVLNLSKKSPDVVNTWDVARVKRESNLLCSFHEKRRLSLLVKVLYQVRCNVFHGEKIPGDPNDDRIVKAALPVLSQLLSRSLTSFRI